MSLVDLYLKAVCWWKGHRWVESPWMRGVGMKYSCTRCFIWCDAIPMKAGQ